MTVSLKEYNKQNHGGDTVVPLFSIRKNISFLPNGSFEKAMQAERRYFGYFGLGSTQ
jgi:hypothetical protein